MRKKDDSSFKTAVLDGKKINSACKFVHAGIPKISENSDDTKNSQTIINPNFSEPFDTDNEVDINSYQNFSIENFPFDSESL